MDWYSDDSDPDIDEDLREDLDALRRSCILSGADPDAAVAQVSSGLAGPSTPSLSTGAPPGAAANHHHHAAAAAAASSDDDEDEDEDLALVRSIRANLHHLHSSKASPPLTDTAAPATGADDPSSPRPICTWPPSDTDEEEDDLETLRAIQRRFSHYQSSTSTASPKTMKPEASQEVHSDPFVDRSDDDFAAQKQNANAPHRDGFPKAALLLVDALKKNRACQKFIRRKMVHIEAKIEENKDLRDRVRCLLGYQLCCRKSVGRSLGQKEDPRVRLISPMKSTQPCTKNKYRKMPALFLGPAENPHVSKYEMVLKQFPMSFKKQPWSDAEKDKLARGIKQQYQETLILDSLNNGSADGDFSAVDMAYALTNGAGNFEVTPENLRSVLPLINWNKISAMYLPGRSGAECESRWLNSDDPLINHEAWNADEETRLLLIVQENGMCNWINIAATLGTYRTPFQCLVRYQRSLNPHILNKAWTKEEDLQLQAAVETFGQKWQLVSGSLDGRTGAQCSNRWRKTLHPKRTSVGRWLLDEDKRLMVTVKLIGPGRWSLIAPFIPGRTQTQIFERWCNILDPDLYLDDWRPEEDSMLLASVSEFGPCWSKIAKTIIPGRNDSMCYRRWRKLCKHEVPKVREARQLKKAIFQTNFVDREKERPAIRPRDLMLLLPSKGEGCDGAIVRGRSKQQGEEDLAVSNIVNISAGLDCVASNSVLNTSSRRSRRASSGRRSKKNTEGNNIAVPDDLNASSSAPSSSRKRKSTTGNNVAAKKRLRGSISISADNEVGTNEITDSVAVSEEGVVKKRARRSKPVGNEGAVRKRRGSDNETGTNRIMESGAVGEEGGVKKRIRRSKPVGNEGADNEAGTNKITGSVVVGEIGTNEISDSVAVGEEGVVKKRARRLKPVGNEGAVRKRIRRSKPVGNEGADNEAGTNKIMGSVVVGEDGVVKKRTRRSKHVGNEGAVRKRRGSINNDEAGTDIMMDPAFANEGVVKKKTRRSKPVGTEGGASIGGGGTENLGAVTKSNRASSRRKSAEVNLPTEGVLNAVPGLEILCATSEERVDVGNMDKGRRKSTPRPKQINMSEGDADKNSTFTRLSNCLSFARMKGINRNKR